MRFVSWNINSVRLRLESLKRVSDKLQPDFLCLQETKALEDQVNTDLFEKMGYQHFWHSAQKKGYSGVAILTKTNPLHVQAGTGIEHMDFEGRVIRADYGNVSVISLYLPSGTNLDRLEHKFKFMDDFQ